jgi:HAD superfamily hydrolase (TIGR01484 family)
MKRKIIAFDLDDTLAITKSPIHDEMSVLLTQLLEKYEVCIISGGKFEQFKMQVIDRLPTGIQNLSKLHLMPTCGTRYYQYEEDKWKLKYAEDLTQKEKEHVIQVLTQQAKALGVWQDKTWGEIIEDRGSQVTYSALGQQAPPEEKYKWAEDNQNLKKKFRDYVAERVPELEVRLGGSTSLDITKPGIDKAYGMRKLLERAGYKKESVLFIGDKLEEGGNDYPVKAFGIECIAVEKWEDTKYVIEGIIKVS